LKPYLQKQITSALQKLNFPSREINFDIPKEEKFGDLSCNIALILSKELKRQPRKIAEEIVKNLQPDKDKISKIEIAGPGFINFFISENYYKEILLQILDQKENYGKSDLHKDQTANLEWVSANPTGPLHAGHGRHVCLGKAIASLLEWSGYKVTREYYYNDAGNQMADLGSSIRARYNGLFSSYNYDELVEYKGDYIITIAKKIKDEYGDKYIESKTEPDYRFFKNIGEKYCFELIKNTLRKLGIQHDIFFNESKLYPSSYQELGLINNTIELDRLDKYPKSEIIELLMIFRDKNLIYIDEGAVYLKIDASEDYEKDKVIIKSTGEPTYRLPDMAYHIDKIKRGYDLIIDIFGSDHGDTYKEVLYGVKAAGYDTSKVKVIIHQMVTFKSGDESVKMSKRSDNVYYLDDLINDIGVDATQFFFVMRSANTHLDFDIELAKEQSDKNPVYYLQYAHARIAGILRNADENLPEYKKTNILNPDLIRTEEEINLLKILSRFPEEVLSAASSFEPHRIITYLNEVASRFHIFYHNNRVVNPDEKEISLSRLQICLAAKQVLKNGFDIIGISAPERM
jgi:arginyl-tRNA synthetase